MERKNSRKRGNTVKSSRMRCLCKRKDRPVFDTGCCPFHTCIVSVSYQHCKFLSLRAISPTMGRSGSTSHTSSHLCSQCHNLHSQHLHWHGPVGIGQCQFCVALIIIAPDVSQTSNDVQPVQLSHPSQYSEFRINTCCQRRLLNEAFASGYTHQLPPAHAALPRPP